MAESEATRARIVELHEEAMKKAGVSNFVNDRHALYVGWVCGIARKAGLRAWPTVDEEGNYTDRIGIELGVDPVTSVQIFVIVPPPSDNWTMP